MIKKITRYFLPLIVIGLLAGAVMHTWRSRKRGDSFLEQELVRQKSLVALGDIRVDPKGLTYDKLIAILRQPASVVDDGKGSTRVGWACAGEECDIWAFFRTPTQGSVAGTAPALALRISRASPLKSQVLSIGGTFIGEPVDQLIKVTRDKGFAVDPTRQRLSWDENWDVIWTAYGDRVGSLYFLNMTEIDRASSNRSAEPLREP